MSQLLRGSTPWTSSRQALGPNACGGFKETILICLLMVESLPHWPDRFLNLFEFTPTSITKANKIVDYATAKQTTSNLKQAIAIDWDIKMETVSGKVVEIGEVACAEAEVGYDSA